MKASEIIDMCIELTARVRTIADSKDAQIVIQVSPHVFNALRSSVLLEQAAQGVTFYDPNGVDAALRTSTVRIAGIIFVPER